MLNTHKNIIGIVGLFAMGFLMTFVYNSACACAIYNDTGHIVQVHHEMGTTHSIEANQQLSWEQKKGSVNSFNTVIVFDGNKRCDLSGNGYSLKKGEYLKLKVKGKDGCDNDVCLYKNENKDPEITCQFKEPEPDA